MTSRAALAGVSGEIQRLVLGFRPPPWLALPPLLAISRCLAGSIAAKPRLEPPLFVAAIVSSPVPQTSGQRCFGRAVHNAD
jgi:hypothetical protein